MTLEDFVIIHYTIFKMNNPCSLLFVTTNRKEVEHQTERPTSKNPKLKTNYECYYIFPLIFLFKSFKLNL